MSVPSHDYISGDAAFGQPFIDIDEQREYPRPHRYIHGGFEGTQTLFSFYYPAAEKYQGRFIQWLEGGAGGNEALMSIPLGKSASIESVSSHMDWFYDLGFDDLGAYLVESNQGHYRFQGGLGMEDDIRLWRASAESARFSRFVARQIYGEEPHHGYIGGASGGGIRTISCLENAPDVWAGGVPQVCTFNPSIAWTAQARATLILGSDVKSVIDATEPGGGGDPFAGLSALQRDALVDLYRVGWPRQSERQIVPAAHWAFQFTSIEATDPTYFDDFWTQPGYAGADTPALLQPYLIHKLATVKKVLPISAVMSAAMLDYFQIPADTPYGLELDVDNPDTLFMANLRVTNGQAMGRDLLINSTHGGLSAFGERTPQLMQGIQPGDQVEIDNRKFLAFCHYYRHAVHSLPEYQFNGGASFVQGGKPFTADGAPIFPQRIPTSLVGRDLPIEKRGHRGDFNTKMILIGAAKDVWVWPTQVVDYIDLVRTKHGAALSEKFRAYWVENATHGGPQTIAAMFMKGDPRVWDTMLVDYLTSVTRQSYRYVVDWVEKGIAPPADTVAEFNVDNALVFPATAAERKGVQPVVTVTANGGTRAEVRIGETVRFEGFVDAPPAAGTIVGAEWDFEMIGDYPLQSTTGEGQSRQLRVTSEYQFKKPGTYFVAFRAGIHRDGRDATSAPTHNIGRVRVVVN